MQIGSSIYEIPGGREIKPVPFVCGKFGVHYGKSFRCRHRRCGSSNHENCLLKFTEGNSQIWRKCSGRTVSDGAGTEYSLSEAGAAPEPVVGRCANGEKHMMRMHDLSRVSFAPVLYGISEYESGR